MLGSSVFSVMISSVRSTYRAVEFSNMCLNVFGLNQQSAQRRISAMQFISLDTPQRVVSYRFTIRL